MPPLFVQDAVWNADGAGTEVYIEWEDRSPPSARGVWTPMLNHFEME
jgi:hypothetical protein